MATSSIEWTDETWNPTTGCDKVSSGCRFCYAESFSKRLKAMGVEKYADEFAFRMHEDALEQPLSWKKPRYVFVNSMSDLFHEEMDDDFLLRVFDIMRQVPQHRFQVLTKRAERLLEVEERLSLDWPPNVWMGVSVESETYTHRVDLLRESRAAVKFLSIEPLISKIETLNFRGIDWVIVGGESGHNPREMKADWVRDIRDACSTQDVAFFFKQWGGRNKKANGRELDGQTYDEMPEPVGLAA